MFMRNIVLPSLIILAATVCLDGPAGATPRGEEIYHSICGNCHTLNPPPTTAPPVRGLVMNYARTFNTREQFVTAVKDWATSPAVERSHMPFAIERFGLMPPFPLADEDLKLVSGWMWDAIKGDAAQMLTTKERAALLGQGITQNLMKEIRGKLEEALQNGPPSSALSFCSEHAIPITAAVTQREHPGVTIARISELNRNPGNAPAPEDLEILQKFQESGSKEAVVLESPDGNFRYYRPIYLEPICLTCHGEKSTFDKEMSKKLLELYPNDKATGYKDGDFRGAIKVTIPPPACQH